MFTIIQSHRTERLVDELLKAYRAKDLPIFAEFIVIVPSMVLGEWLDKSIASQAGISTLVTTTFWGQYQWTLMQKVLADYNVMLAMQQREDEIITVPEVAVLTNSVMQWRLFGYFTYYQAQIMSDEKHPLYPLLSTLLDESADRSQQDVRLWSLAMDFARVFNRYLTHRENWLTLWSQDKAVDIEALIAEKDRLTLTFDQYAGVTPDWLVEHYIELEVAQRHLWRLLFAAVYEHRATIETRFWQVMAGSDSRALIATDTILPKLLHIFTIQQLPQNELNFLQKLSQYVDITLLHYNPSQLFWADIVDKQWLQRQQVIHPQSVFLRDYGHTLLSRLGKQSRETFAMLASLSGNEHQDDFRLEWQDKFETECFEFTDERSLSLLAHLQHDVLMLDESATPQAAAARVSAALGSQMALDLGEDENSLSSYNDNNKPSTAPKEDVYSDKTLENKHFEQTRHWQLSQHDHSLSIHSCHTLQRQLEVLRAMIGRWLNDKNADGSTRHLSDIVVMLPDVERHYDLITSVFVTGEGQDGLNLPAKVTGVVDTSIRQLWEAIRGFYGLLGSDTARFEAPEVLDWLMLPPLYESLGLTHEQMSRACDLLDNAGFVRGFDEAHLQQTLDSTDYDYRFSFAYALDQMALGLLMPQAGISDCLYPDNWQVGVIPEKTIPIAAISLADAPIIEALCRIYTGLNHCRHEYIADYKAEKWLERIENQVIHTYFGALDQTRPMRAIFNAMNGFKSSLRANSHYQRYHRHTNDAAKNEYAQVEARLSQVGSLPLKLSFMLGSIEEELESQQVSAEPTGVITFGRFGALRNVPFGLVVMLNMDLSEFPNRDRDNRYDLMKSGLAQRGDRFSEDDDNGAFLDALLCARAACWIFYNGQRLTDTHEHLPANPVSELLQFLQGEVEWQWQPLTAAQNTIKDNTLKSSLPATSDDTDVSAQVQRYLPQLVEQWLVTHHPALPFAAEVFVAPDFDTVISDNLDTRTLHNDKSAENAEDNKDVIKILERAMRRDKLSQQRTYAPAKVWQSVFEHLQVQDKAKQAVKVKLPSNDDYTLIVQCLQPENNAMPAELISVPPTTHDTDEMTQVDLPYLYRQVRHPAKHFLREQQVHIVMPEDDTVYQEPLSLSGLNGYKVKQTLLAELYDTGFYDTTATQNTQPQLPVVPQNIAQEKTALKQLLYNPIMPAGVARQSTLQYQQLKITQHCQDFAAKLVAQGIEVDMALNGTMLLTPCAEKMVSVEAPDINKQGQLQIKGMVPSVQHNDAHASAPKFWLNILPNSARAQYLLHFWLAHIYWQVTRQTTAAQVADNDGCSIWHFNKPSNESTKFKSGTTFELPPIEYDTALAELLKWVRFSQLTAHTPTTILPVYALVYLHQVQQAQAKESIYQPKRSDFKDWLWVDYNHDMIFDTCSQHELWQYILQDQDAFAALNKAQALAQPLFGMMHDTLTAL